jgi:alcohol dehydrogenase class IV
MDDRETSEDDDADSGAEPKRKAMEAAAVATTAGHTSEFGRSTMMKGHIRKLKSSIIL